MNTFRIVGLLAASVFLFSCSRGLPPPRYWEIPNAEIGAESIEFSFIAPVRDCPEGYWAYRLGIVLPAGTDFDLAGRVTIYSKDGDLKKSFRFDAATASSWLNDSTRTSHLLADGSKDYYNDLGIDDGKFHRVKIEFDHPSTTEVGVALHFLSYTNPPPEIIE